MNVVAIYVVGKGISINYSLNRPRQNVAHNSP